MVGESGLLGGPPPPLPHDELIPRRAAVRFDRAHDDRLHEAELADRVHELGQRVTVEHLPRLPRVRFDGRRIDLPVHRADVGDGGCGGAAQTDVGRRVTHPRAHVVRARRLGGPGRNQRCESAAKAALLA